MKFKKEADKLYSKLESYEEEGETIYFKKRIVKPPLNLDGSINWFNFLTGGSWWRIIGVMVFLIIALGFIWEYHSNFQTCIEAINEINQLKNISATLP